MSDVTIVVTTWLPPGNEIARAEAFQTAARSWQKHLKCSTPIHLHVADDGSPDDGDGKLLLEATMASWHRGVVTSTRQKRMGVGASLNAGFSAAFRTSPIALYAVDDWELLTDLDLDPWVKLLTTNHWAGLVRFFAHPDVEGQVKHISEVGWAVRLNRHHFAYGFRPALYHERFIRDVGRFKEGVNSFDCEDDYNKRWCKQLTGTDIYLALPDLWRPIETGSLAHIVPS